MAKTHDVKSNILIQMMRKLFEIALDSTDPDKNIICALIELVAGLDYARTPGVGNLNAILSEYKPEHKKYIEHFVETIQKFNLDDMQTWFRIRAVIMDIYATLVIANCSTPVIIFYGGAHHTENVANALKRHGYTVEKQLKVNKQTSFFEETLQNSQKNQEIIFLGEDHFRTPLKSAAQLLRDLQNLCKRKNTTPTTFCIERHLNFEREDPKSFPNEMACNSPELAIHATRCNPIMGKPCKNLVIRFVDNRHCDLSFLRKEINEASNVKEFQTLYKIFQKNAKITIVAMLRNLIST